VICWKYSLVAICYDDSGCWISSRRWAGACVWDPKDCESAAVFASKGEFMEMCFCCCDGDDERRLSLQLCEGVSRDRIGWFSSLRPQALPHHQISLLIVAATRHPSVRQASTGSLAFKRKRDRIYKFPLRTMLGHDSETRSGYYHLVDVWYTELAIWCDKRFIWG
jgi:hypothetical protein